MVVQGVESMKALSEEISSNQFSIDAFQYLRCWEIPKHLNSIAFNYQSLFCIAAVAPSGRRTFDRIFATSTKEKTAKTTLGFWGWIDICFSGYRLLLLQLGGQRWQRLLYAGDAMIGAGMIDCLWLPMTASYFQTPVVANTCKQPPILLASWVDEDIHSEIRKQSQ